MNPKLQEPEPEPPVKKTYSSWNEFFTKCVSCKFFSTFFILKKNLGITPDVITKFEMIPIALIPMTTEQQLVAFGVFPVIAPYVVDHAKRVRKNCFC